MCNQSSETNRNGRLQTFSESLIATLSRLLSLLLYGSSRRSIVLSSQRERALDEHSVSEALFLLIHHSAISDCRQSSSLHSGHVELKFNQLSFSNKSLVHLLR